MTLLLDTAATAQRPSAAAAREAAARGDWPAALAAWQDYGALHGGDPEAQLGQAEAYRALDNAAGADAVLRHLDAHRKSPAAAISFALNAQVAANWADALQRWHAAREQFPDVPATWAGEAALLQIFNRFEQADQLTSQAIGHFPDSIDVLAQHFNVALARQDWQEADRRLSAIERLHPQHAYTLREVPPLRERVKSGLAGMENVKLIGLALEAENQTAWDQSTRLWKILYERDPTSSLIIMHFGHALRESGQFAEAETILSRGIAAFPEDLEMRAHHSLVPAVQHRWAEAATRWQQTLKKFPAASVLWPMAAAAYTEAGLTRAAELLLEQAILLEPARVELHVLHAKAAEHAEDWTAAVARWNTALHLRPDDQNLQNSRGDAIWQETLSRLEHGLPEDAASAAPALQEPQPASPAALKQLALNFEGLGDNCEFGIVQRRFGADPIGLFRFAATQAAALIKLLNEDLEPLGDPAHTELGLTSGDEYMIRDHRLIYHMHCFVRKDAVEPQAFLKKQVTRLGYLKRKMLEDLEHAEKIFVFKSSFGILRAEIDLLHQAINRHGRNTLLVVTRAQNGESPGTLHILADRLCIGYVGTLYDSDDSEIDFAAWQQILEAAERYKNTLDGNS